MDSNDLYGSCRLVNRWRLGEDYGQSMRFPQTLTSLYQSQHSTKMRVLFFALSWLVMRRRGGLSTIIDSYGTDVIECNLGQVKNVLATPLNSLRSVVVSTLSFTLL